ncbi:hypothetical protein [Mesorhizobium sp.]|uniref:hypothetical protein n=1 Tax=Mesorhizobium sp. TaxID=1871066 RepID=UPI0025805012|nr:hypothetical protein [Mesorhizobium sp.]
MVKSDEYPLVSLRLRPDLLPRIANAMKRQNLTSRPAWLTAVIEAALVEQESAAR